LLHFERKQLVTPAPAIMTARGVAYPRFSNYQCSSSIPPDGHCWPW